MQPNELPTTAAPPPPRPAAALHAPAIRRRPRWLHLALFAGCIAWYRVAALLASSAASGFSLRLDLTDEQPLFAAVALLFLVVTGISAARAVERGLAPLRWSLGLPRRDTAREEWATGAALGWGIAALTVLAMVLGRALHAHVWVAPHAFLLLGLGAATLAAGTLAKVLALYGYGFQHLTEAMGAAKGTVFMMAVVVIDAVVTPTPYGTADGSRVLVSGLGALLLCLCWLRTRGAWMGWGAWFGWAASTALVFGLPLGLSSAYGALVESRTTGPVWLTGGAYGPSAAAVVPLLLLAAIPILLRVTDEYAWRYTRQPIVPAGIAVDIPAPAAHAAMEEVPAAAPALVQIQGAGPAAGPGDGASN